MDWNQWFQTNAQKLIDTRLQVYAAGNQTTVDPATGAIIPAGKPAPHTVAGVSMPVMIGGGVLLLLAVVYLLKD